MAKEKKIPQRRCVATGIKTEKKNLFRVVRTPEGNVSYDPTGKANGRGAYVAKTKQAIEKARKSKILNKHLECEVPDELYDLLLGRLTSDE